MIDLDKINSCLLPPPPSPGTRYQGTYTIRYKIRGEANGRDGIMKQDFRYELGQSQS